MQTDEIPEWEHITAEDGWERHEIILGHLYLDISQSKDRKKWETAVNTEDGECLREGLAFPLDDLESVKVWLLGVAVGVAQAQADRVMQLSTAVMAASATILAGEPSTYDYRHATRTLGHDYTFTPIDDGMRGRMVGWGPGGSGIRSVRIKAGDFLLLNHPGEPAPRSREARYRVTAIEYKQDPKDMWSADVEYAERTEEEARQQGVEP